MAFSKNEAFTDTDQQLALWAKALSHPARIAILRELAQRNACICGELVANLPLSQATVSQHLKVLKEAGLIDGEIDGPRICYCIDWPALKEMENALILLFNQIKPCC
ncbi:MAG TPA: metalloregulator ArsR/SmtB family transcription factor [Saprospiraceae bacterium]|nr:winged helix-turn-helix transcriptional regulator [Saprospiraceae bacterium]MCB9268273.1 winged helix-turn-helix transcriptional regulator [Lewinellaceae bacterium]HPG06291.1 metalloregulator ArsR/SmtB family transcription factor [Saprospiraceae bacterium]HPQ98384.1 metalloregulator ArsR/SmtB family transcription factor [Saprospiraceae bacterium]HQU59777.1 metalloregulator ArsR/SmtB family transcription factor [Saprospiraceae bacterium]